jgi:hypothetical protein
LVVVVTRAWTAASRKKTHILISEMVKVGFCHMTNRKITRFKHANDHLPLCVLGGSTSGSSTKSATIEMYVGRGNNVVLGNDTISGETLSSLSDKSGGSFISNGDHPHSAAAAGIVHHHHGSSGGSPRGGHGHQQHLHNQVRQHRMPDDVPREEDEDEFDVSSTTISNLASLS